MEPLAILYMRFQAVIFVADMFIYEGELGIDC